MKPVKPDTALKFAILAGAAVAMGAVLAVGMLNDAADKRLEEERGR